MGLNAQGEPEDLESTPERGTEGNGVVRSPKEVPPQERPPWAAKGLDSSYPFLSSVPAKRQGPPGSQLRISEPACHSIPAVCSLTCLFLAVLRLQDLTTWFILLSPPSPTQTQGTKVSDNSNLNTHP